MGLNIISKFNTSLKFISWKNNFLLPPLRRLLCKALIQPHLDYAYSVWYPTSTKKFKTKLQTLQNKCVRFCIQLDSGAHVEIEFKKINCPPVDYIFGQYLTPNSLDIP